MGYASKYVQNKGHCSGHWKGKPPGTSYTGDGCWACAKGCAVLCLLALKGKEPDETNIKANLNSSADCTWSGFTGTTEKFPAIMGVGGHFVVQENSAGDVWDPSGGKSAKISSYTVASKHYPS